MADTETFLRRATSVTIGAVVLAWDRIAGPATDAGRGRWWRDAAVGAVFGVEDAAAGSLVELGRRVTDRLADLAARGAAETELGRHAATSAAHALANRVATSPLVNRVVDAQLDRVVRPLVGTVLDDVLARLDADPERVRSLIRDQRESITDELADRIRSGAAASDAAVQGTVRRLLARPRRPAAPADLP